LRGIQTVVRAVAVARHLIDDGFVVVFAFRFDLWIVRVSSV
jgi:hypothetical protein